MEVKAESMSIAILFSLSETSKVFTLISYFFKELLKF